MQKEKLQRILDQFLRDHEFRIRMTEHHRDEEVCRPWDGLANEDDTHHLSEQEYFYYENNWLLFFVLKKNSNTISLSNRSDFKKRCLSENDYKKVEKNHTCLLTFTSTYTGSWHRVHLLHGGIGKIPIGLLTIQKAKEEASQVLNERGDPLIIVLWRKPSKMAFTNSIHFVTDGLFTADGGLL